MATKRKRAGSTVPRTRGGYQLHELRKRHGRTARWCCAELQVHPTTWSQWETGGRVPSGLDVQDISILFRVPVAELALLAEGK